jgi:hypothetical protein
MYPIELLASHNRVCNVLDGLADSEVRPADRRKPMYSAIDELRALVATPELICVAERISIALLDWAILNKDSEKEEDTRQRLAALGETWRSMAGMTGAMANHTGEDELDQPEVSPMTDALERINQRSH